MKNISVKFTLLLFLSILFTPSVFAQVVTDTTQVNTDTTNIWTITTLDGNEYIGNILKEDSTSIHLKTASIGVIVIPLEQIKHREKIDKRNMFRGEFWFENPQSTRYFWAPNGYGLKKGEAYFQNIWILANQASYGFTDHFTMGLGTVPLFLFGPEVGEITPFWVTPKVSIPIKKDKINVAAGAFLGGVSNVGWGGLLYGSFSYGSRNNNMSFNIGYGILDDEWSKRPTLSLNFMVRVSPRTYLLSENYYISAGNDNIGLVSFGARTVWNNISLDYGLVAPIIEGQDFFFALPWLGFSIPMGKLRRGS